MTKLLKAGLFCFVLFAGGLSAQNLKFGYIDIQQLIQVMPETEVAQKAYAKVGADLQVQLESMQKDLSEKSKDYMAQLKIWSEAIRLSKETELQSLNQRVQNFPQQAQESLRKEEAKLFQPVMEKARKAIADVGKEQGLTFVFEVNNVLYHSEQPIELLPFVKKKLGIK
jgi:outer membrane protein